MTEEELKDIFIKSIRFETEEDRLWEENQKIKEAWEKAELNAMAKHDENITLRYQLQIAKEALQQIATINGPEVRLIMNQDAMAKSVFIQENVLIAREALEKLNADIPKSDPKKAADLIVKWANEPGDYDEKVSEILEKLKD